MRDTNGGCMMFRERSRAAWCAALALTIGLLAGSVMAQGDALAPEARHEASAQVIGELLSHYHFRRQALDDDLSVGAFETYFESLDPQRYFFLRDDLDRFAPFRTRLDDQLRAGRLDTAWEIFEVYRKRVSEASETALDLLDADLAFDVDESYRIDRSEAAWPRNEQARDELWRQRVKNDILSLRLANVDDEEIDNTLEQRYSQLHRNLEQYNADDVFEIYMNAWTGLFDPHTSYLSPRTRENFDINMSLSLQGIGALLRTDGNFTEIADLIQGGPAANSGELDVGDRIVGVGQNGDPYVSVVGWRLPDVVDLIRGPKDSVVRLQVLPAAASGDGDRRTVSLTRNEIVLTDRAARSKMLEPNDDSRRVGVIELSSFYHDFNGDDGDADRPRSTTDDVRELLGDMLAEGMESLVIDLRGNAGGSLLEATRLTGLFLDAGPVVQIRYSDGEESVLRDEDQGRIVYDGPLVVLVDGFSASASEIFAAAIQDYGRGAIVGSQTFGKGTVQDLVDLNRYRVAADGRAGSLKFTRAKYYRVTGGSTQMRGVEPDLGLDSLLNGARRVNERTEPNALPWDEIETVAFHRNNLVGRLLPELRTLHAARLRDDPALQALRDEVSHNRAARERDTVSLHEENRRAEQQARERVRLDAVNRRLSAIGERPVDDVSDLDEQAVTDLVLREVGRVALDLADLLARDHPDTRSATAER